MRFHETENEAEKRPRSCESSAYNH